MSPRWLLATVAAVCATIVIAVGEAAIWPVQHRHPPAPPAELADMSARIDAVNAVRRRPP